mmetsp:Transcript_1974/g.3056  ORF Transcript_1974/g.3056 Transcript_1974/m.3056 type:complete len:228 (-) Transcript_1974:26-709(-)
MWMIALFSLRRAEASDASLENPEKSLQAISIARAFEHVHLENLQVARQGLTCDEMCYWEYISDSFIAVCLDEVMVELTILDHAHIGAFTIGFLPNSLVNLMIVHCHQEFPIETHDFPRESRNINLAKNLIKGRPDLTALPSKLNNLELQHNHLHGPILLTRLPGTLQTLNLGHNRLDQKVVYYKDLPHDIQKIYLDHCAVKEVRVVKGCAEVKDKTVFQGINLKKVR